MTAAVVAQVSRSGRQARLRMFLGGCEILPFTPDQAHPVGRILGAADRTDVVDGHLVLVAGRREIFTSDPGDLRALAAHVRPVPVIRPV